MTTFTATPEFETLRAFYIVNHNERVKADLPEQAMERALVACETVENTVMILMGERLDNDAARDHWRSILRHGR